MQRYFSNKKEDNNFILNNDDWYHINTVMRKNNGDEIEVIYDNTLYICKILDNKVLIDRKIDSIKRTKTEYVLVLPLLQDTKMSLVLQKATELGITEIIPIYTTRSKINLDDKEDKKIIRWTRICKEASEQSKRFDIPKISNIKNIEDLNEDGLKIVCSTREKENTLKKVLQTNASCDRIVMVVGPEGGLTDLEEDKLIQLGFIPTSLGNNIMRVETVPIYLLSVLNYVME